MGGEISQILCARFARTNRGSTDSIGESRNLINGDSYLEVSKDDPAK